MFYAACRERAAAVWAVGLAVFIAGLLPALDSPALLPKRRMKQAELFQEWIEIHRENALINELVSSTETVGGGLEILRGMAVYPVVINRSPVSGYFSGRMPTASRIWSRNPRAFCRAFCAPA